MDFEQNKKKIRQLEVLIKIIFLTFIIGIISGILLIVNSKEFIGFTIIIVTMSVDFIMLYIVGELEEEIKKNGYDLGIYSYKKVKKLLKNKSFVEYLINEFIKRLKYLNFRCDFDCDTFMVGDKVVAEYYRKRYNDLINRYKRHIKFLEKIYDFLSKEND